MKKLLMMITLAILASSIHIGTSWAGLTAEEKRLETLQQTAFLHEYGQLDWWILYDFDTVIENSAMLMASEFVRGDNVTVFINLLVGWVEVTTDILEFNPDWIFNDIRDQFENIDPLFKKDFAKWLFTNRITAFFILQRSIYVKRAFRKCVADIALLDPVDRPADPYNHCRETLLADGIVTPIILTP